MKRSPSTRKKSGPLGRTSTLYLYLRKPTVVRPPLDAWLGHRGTEPGPLFVSVTKGGAVVLRRMTDQSVLDLVRRLARRAGIARFSPHDLRRTFISDMLDLGVDISTVQQLAGHSQVTTTARYDHRGEHVRRRAAEMLHVLFAAM